MTTATLIALGATGLSACSGREDDKESAETLATGLIRVKGAVTVLNDQVPVDGGVTIEVNDPKRGTVTLNFESMFTLPRPTEDRTKLYEEIRKVKVGDVVNATARPLEDGVLRLESIEVVPER